MYRLLFSAFLFYHPAMWLWKSISQKREWINSAPQQVSRSPPWCPSRCQSWLRCLAVWGMPAWESLSWPTRRPKRSTARSTWPLSAVSASRQTLRFSSTSGLSRNAGCNCSRYSVYTLSCHKNNHRITLSYCQAIVQSDFIQTSRNIKEKGCSTISMYKYTHTEMWNFCSVRWLHQQLLKIAVRGTNLPKVVFYCREIIIKQ